MDSFISDSHLWIYLIYFSIISPTILPAQNNLEVDKIKALVAAYSDAREASDASEIRPLLTNDADQLVSSGEWRHGIDALVSGMLQSSKNNPGQRTLTVEKVRFMDQKNAIADARYEITGADGTMRKMWSTFILHKLKKKWKIAAIRNMLPAGR